jgi:hypothetical protein
MISVWREYLVTVESFSEILGLLPIAVMNDETSDERPNKQVTND